MAGCVTRNAAVRRNQHVNPGYSSSILIESTCYPIELFFYYQVCMDSIIWKCVGAYLWSPLELLHFGGCCTGVEFSHDWRIDIMPSFRWWWGEVGALSVISGLTRKKKKSRVENTCITIYWHLILIGFHAVHCVAIR